ncbi:T-box transcription factor TBX19-like [Haliotis cracherodii]|uniref:T-box transcription factor TBX19-like n=1 Tax=Haliotis cracherodii TaxID=6455 RepID=UPI0039EB9461
MIINRNGRRMFPHVTVSTSGLTPSGLYNVWLEILPADGRRFKYIQGEWLPVSPADPSSGSTPYLHLDSPNTGAFWMQKKISFARLKLTNNRDSAEGNVMLQSMHKYMVRILISETGKDVNATVPKTFTFPETTFMAVTAYQNNHITKLKIHNNPFAKAFRDKHIGRNYQKRSRGAAWSLPDGYQDTSQPNRKRKRDSKEDAAALIKDHTGLKDGFNSVGQAMSRSNPVVMDRVPPYGCDIFPSARGTGFMCNAIQNAGLSPLYRPFHHQTTPAVGGLCPLPPFMYPARYFLSPEVSLAHPHPSNYPLPIPANSSHAPCYSLPNYHGDLS